MKDYNPNWVRIINEQQTQRRLAKKEGIELGREQGVKLGLKFAAKIADLSWNDPKSDRIARIIASAIRSADPSVVCKYLETNHD